MGTRLSTFGPNRRAGPAQRTLACWRRILCGFAVGLTWLSLAAADQPNPGWQASRWSRPLAVSPAGPNAWFPDVTADSTGRVHVVWSSGTPGYDQVLYADTLDGQTWSAVNDIAAMPQVAGSEATRPSIWAGPASRLHLVYRSTAVLYTEAAADRANPIGAWTTPVQISGDQVAYFSRVVADRNGYLHIVFTENVPSNACAVCFHLFYRQSSDNGATWSPAIDISPLPTGVAKPQILIDMQNNLHVVWEAGRGGAYGQLEDPTQVMYSASYDAGRTWTAPVRITSINSQIEKNVTIGLGPEGQLVLVWLSLPGDYVYYQISTNLGRSWTSPKRIQGVWGGWSVYPARLDDYSMATDNAGDTHLVLVGRTSAEDEALRVLKLTWNGATWSGPESIVRLMGDAPEWPRIAVSLGNRLHVVWFVRDQEHIWESDAGQYRVWYAQGVSTAQPVAPATSAASVAQATPTLAVMPDVSPSASVAVAADFSVTPIAPGMAETLYSENDDLVLIAQGLLPAVALVSLVLVGRRLWRR